MKIAFLSIAVLLINCVPAFGQGLPPTICLGLNCDDNPAHPGNFTAGPPVGYNTWDDFIAEFKGDFGFHEDPNHSYGQCLDHCFDHIEETKGGCKRKGIPVASEVCQELVSGQLLACVVSCRTRPHF